LVAHCCGNAAVQQHRPTKLRHYRYGHPLAARAIFRQHFAQ